MDSCALEASVAYEDLVESVLHAYRDDSQNYPWIVGFSGGKDSTLVAHLVFDAVMQVAPRRRNRQIYFVSNDTLVESPFVTRQVQEQFDMVQCAADCSRDYTAQARAYLLGATHRQRLSLSQPEDALVHGQAENQAHFPVHLGQCFPFRIGHYCAGCPQG